MAKPNVDTLKKMREFLTPRERWTTGVYYAGIGDIDRLTDIHGCAVVPGIACCILGAAFAVTPCEDVFTESGFEIDVGDLLRPCIKEKRPDLSLETTNPAIKFNDDPGTTHQDVLDVLDCAIAKHEQP